MSGATAAAPSPGHALRATFAFAQLGARQERAGFAAWAGRLGFYCVILLIFSRLWDVIFAERLLDDPRFSASAFVWYLALTEWATLSTPQIWMDIEADVRSGDVAQRLCRPVSYVVGKLAEAAGALLPRLVVLGGGGLGFAAIVAGGLPQDPRGLVWAIPIVVFAALLQLLSFTIVGLTALWLDEVGPVYWIWQKGMFLLGGLMVPLAIYPDVVREVAWWTPFAPMLNGLGRLAFGATTEELVQTFVALAFWIAVACVVLSWQFRRGVRGLETGGG